MDRPESHQAVIEAPAAQEVVMVAEVLVDVGTKALERKVFSYRIPDGLLPVAAVGAPVSVPFGGHPQLPGFILNLSPLPEEELGYKLRDINDVLDEQPLFGPEYLAFLEWVSHYYATPLLQVIGCALPGTLVQKLRKEVFFQKFPDQAEDEAALGTDGRRVLRYLQEKQKAYTPKYLSTQLKIPLKTLTPLVQKLKQAGCVSVETQLKDGPKRSRVKSKQSGASTESGELSPLALTEAQQQVVASVLANENNVPYVLFGVTGSGKTEVYMALTQQMLDQGKSVLLLVPEIALTSQIAKRFLARFGAENVALWHSNLSDGEKNVAWREILAGQRRLVIGTRSAVFTPLQDLGLILMDECHDGSFKQDAPAPRYDVRTVAREMARRFDIPVVMGSATPDVVSYHQALADGTLLRLSERFGSRPMAEVTLVNMNHERAAGNTSGLSRALVAALKENLEREEQAIVLMNRRGFYTVITCAQCETVFECPHCEVSLTLHRDAAQARCHYCGYVTAQPEYCPHCASMDLVSSGTGTQRVAEDLAGLFPEVKLARLDSDVTQRKEASQAVLDEFRSGEAQVLVGTQMVAKGLDIPNVTLVGVINADTSFSLPDYQSSERGFQLLTQVAGRAGRGEKPGRVVVQSVAPEHAVIQFARAQDFEAFYDFELMSRERMQFPPYSQLFRLMVSSPEEQKAWQFISAAVEHLRVKLMREGLTEDIELLGPAPCVIPRIQRKYRFHCLVKTRAGKPGHWLLNRFYQAVKPPEGVVFTLDVDAQTLL